MTRAVPTITTNMCMIENDKGQILVQDRQGKSWPGITFPGGHVEFGESFHDAVVREVKEETGLDIKHPILCGVKHFETENNERYIVLCYKTNQYSGDIQSSEEGDVFWINKEDLNSYTLANDFLEMFQLFINPDCSEFYYEKDQSDWHIKLH